MDILVGVFGFQKEELGNDEIRLRVIDRRTDKQDSILQEARKDIVGTLTSAGLLNNHWNQLHGMGLPLHGAQSRVTRLAPSTTLARSYSRSSAFRSSKRVRKASIRRSRSNMSRKASGFRFKAAAVDSTSLLSSSSDMTSPSCLATVSSRSES